MKLLPLLKCFCAAAVLLLAAECTLDAAGQKKNKKDDRPFFAVIQKDGRKASRRCYVDADKNGFCDRGSEQKWKCPNNCRLAAGTEKRRADGEAGEKTKDSALPSGQQKKNGGGTPELKKKNAGDDDGGWTFTPPCAECPLAGGCAGKCFAGLI